MRIISLKKYILFLFLPGMLFSQGKLAKINQDFLIRQMMAPGAITVTQLPDQFLRSGDTTKVKIRFNYTPALRPRVALRYSRNPGGAIYINYPKRVIPTALTGDSLKFNLVSERISAGVYYCILADTGATQQTSFEFILVVEDNKTSNTSTQTPSSGASIPSSGLKFSWDPVVDNSFGANYTTPYYHIILSDSPFVFTQVNGLTKITGINAIFQAIVPYTGQTPISINYGDSDPSGYFNNSNTPPLAKGLVYNWIVLNNYGNNPAYTSDVVPLQPQTFTISDPVTLSPPVLVLPAAGDTINTTTALFKWNKVPNAISYQLLISEQISEQNTSSQGNVVVFSQSTLDTTLTVNGELIFKTGGFRWRVLATDIQGRAIGSELRAFRSTVLSNQVDFDTRDGAVTPLGRVNLVITKKTGAAIPLPVVTPDDGTISRDFPRSTGPTDSLIIVASKEGYSNLRKGIRVGITGNPVIFNMQPNQTQIYGTIKTNRVGTVIYDSLVANATVRFVSGTLNQDISILSGSQGEYRKSLSPTRWAISVLKPGLGASVDTSVTLQNNQTLLRTLRIPNTLIGPAPIVRGYVLLQSNNNSIQNVQVTAKNGNTSFSVLTDGLGFYQISLFPGTWTVSANKTGYYFNPFLYSDNLTSGITQLPPFYGSLSSLLSGQTRDSVSVAVKNPLPGVTVSAYDSSSGILMNQTQSDGFGNYSLSLPVGKFKVKGALINYQPDSVKSFKIASVGSSFTKNLNLVNFPNKVRGLITRAVTGDSLYNVEIRWQSANGYSGVVHTGADGRYSIGVPANTNITLTAIFPGYQTLVNGPFASGIAGTVTTRNLQLTILSISVSGTIRDNTSNHLLKNSTVQAVGTTYQTSTNTQGFYQLFVPSGTYNIKYSKSGFIDSTIVALNLTVNQVRNPKLLRDFKNLSGKVHHPADTTGVVGVNINFNQITDSDFDTTIVTNSSGRFNIRIPRKVNFQISAGKSRYRSAPANYTFALTGDTTGIDFSIDSLAVSKIIINSNNENFVNNQTRNFSATVVDTNNTTIVSFDPNELTWEVRNIDVPAQINSLAGQFSSSQKGLFIPNSGYIGEVLIRVYDSLSGVAAGDTSHIYAELDNTVAQARTLQNESGFKMTFSPANITSLGSKRPVSFTRKILPPPRKIFPGKKVVGKTFFVSELAFPQPVPLTIPVPSGYNGTNPLLSLGSWNDTTLVWDNIPVVTRTADTLQGASARIREFAVLIASEPLGIKNVHYYPNPFSPEIFNINPNPANFSTPVNEYGCSFQFELTSTDLRQPFVTITIYNMAGVVVRKLLNDSPISQGLAAVTWDGKTDSSLMARNGRYVVRVTARDASGTKESIGTVVLIK